jgi:hypothetical protein
LIALAFLLAAAGPHPAVKAERAFAAMAQTKGQWTAFRAFAAPRSVMFVPEPVNAQPWLRDKTDPPRSVMWWPSHVYISCDGKAAVTTGPWIRDGGKSHGYFTTVWAKLPDGSWKWLIDHGDALTTPRPSGEHVATASASCSRPPVPAKPTIYIARTGDELPVALSGASPDKSLTWDVVSYERHRKVTIRLWEDRGYRDVISDDVDISK